MNIKVYTSQTCGQCPTVKKFLGIKGVEFEEVSVDDMDVAVQLQQRSGLVGSPIVEINGQFIKGYNPRWMGEQLNG